MQYTKNINQLLNYYQYIDKKHKKTMKYIHGF
jgi:hypothetical protein